MSTIKSLNKWANAHTYYLLDMVRIVLGVFLFYKGVDFMSDPLQLTEVMKPFENLQGGMIALHYIAPAHFMGGILIVFGLLTRWVALSQLPILIGAVLVNVFGDTGTSNLVLSIITLILCLFFMFYGSGKHSADYFLKMQQ